jgi:outer membrane protein TolC
MKGSRPMTRTALVLRVLAGTVFTTISVTPGAFAQGSGGQAVAVQALPVPLSGRDAAGSVTATDASVPGGTASVNTLNPVVQTQGPYSGSLGSASTQPFSGTLAFREAIQRGLDYNLGSIDVTQSVRQARGQRTVARSALLPNLMGSLTAAREEVNLAAQGLGSLRVPIPGFSFPTIVGPFNYVDLRVRVSQTVVDLTAWNNYRAASETAQASELSLEDAKDLVVLAVGGTYLQALAAKATIDSAQAQLGTANALFQQASERRRVGLVAQLDVNRAHVQVLVQQQRLVSAQNEFAKEKITLARLIGLPPTDRYELADTIPFSAAPAMSLDLALARALATRFDLKAADAQVQAAERALTAARDERLPSASVSADYGAIGSTPSQALGTFAVVGTISIPIWQGGRTEGHIEMAEAAVAQRRAEADDVKNQIEGDVRKAYLDLQAAASQVDVATQNRDVSEENLELTRQRLDTGVSDNVDVVQAQEALAAADLDRINSLFAHNVAKLSLARALGRTAQSLDDLLKRP